MGKLKAAAKAVSIITVLFIIIRVFPGVCPLLGENSARHRMAANASLQLYIVDMSVALGIPGQMTAGILLWQHRRRSRAPSTGTTSGTRRVLSS